MHEGPRRLDLGRILIASLYRLPIDVAHERIDVRLGIRAEVDVVGMLVHIEREDRDAARHGLGMFRRELVDEPAIARQINQQDPARAPRQRVAIATNSSRQRSTDPKVARERIRERCGRLAIAAQAREIELVQERGVERDEFLALQAVDHVAGRLGEVEGLELLRDGVQAPQRAAVVVFIVTLDESHRQSIQQPGTTENRRELVAHVIASMNKVKKGISH